MPDLPGCDAWTGTDPDGRGHDPDPRWRADAACRGTDPDLWYPSREEAGHYSGRGRDGHRLPAIAICQTCPVQAACLTYALDRNERHGEWGGPTPKERVVLRRTRGSAA